LVASLGRSQVPGIVAAPDLGLRASTEASVPGRIYCEHMPRARIATFVLCGLIALVVVPGVVAVAIHPERNGVA